MPLILNIETSTNICSVALSDNKKIVALKETDKENSHSKLLSVFVEEILKEKKITANNLSAVAVSKGPGSYTGLRIGVSFAKGLCFGSDLPLIAVDTLKSIALGYKMNNKISDNEVLLCPMIDARRMEVYCAIFDYNLKVIMPVSSKVIDEKVFSEYLEKNKVHFFGNGAVKCKKVMKNKNAIFVKFNNSATYIALLAEQKYQTKKFEDVAYFEPYYLKDFIAIPPKNKVLRVFNK